MSVGTMNVDGVLVPGVPNTSITGQPWVTFQSVGSQQYPLSSTPVSAQAVSGNTGVVDHASANAQQAISHPLSLKHGVVLPAVLSLIAGVVILDVVFFRKGSNKDQL
jgi:hypothetical protein